MRIVNRPQFLAMPPGTVYQKYEPCATEKIEIKGDSITDDWFVQSIDGLEAIMGSGTSEMMSRCEQMENGGASFPADFTAQGRDGCYNDALFLIWERADVEALIVRLQQSLEDSHASPR